MGVLARIPQRLGHHVLGQALEAAPDRHSQGPVELDLDLGVLGLQQCDLVGQLDRSRIRIALERPLHRRGQLPARLVDLLAAACAVLGGELAVALQHQADREQPLHDAVVYLARQLDVLRQLAAALLLARGDSRRRCERRDLAEHPERVALGFGQFAGVDIGQVAGRLLDVAIGQRLRGILGLRVLAERLSGFL